MSAQSYTATEGTFTTPDGFSLYTKTWTPAATIPLRARLIFVHGFSDHCNGQEPFFPLLSSHGILIQAFDQRGWGRSVHTSAEKGKTGPTTQVLEDITAFIKHSLAANPQHQDLPTFLMGHSMGGQEVLLYASLGDAATRAKIRGFIAEAPFVSLHPAARPLAITVVLGRLAAKLLPNAQMVNKLDPSKLSRDPVKCQEWAADPLCHDTGTLVGLAGMLDRAATLDSTDAKVAGSVLQDGVGDGGATRLLIAHGSKDEVCAIEGARAFYERAKVQDKTFKQYDGWFHKLHVEPEEDKVRFTKDVADWILERAGPLDAQAKL